MITVIIGSTFKVVWIVFIGLKIIATVQQIILRRKPDEKAIRN